VNDPFRETPWSDSLALSAASSFKQSEEDRCPPLDRRQARWSPGIRSTLHPSRLASSLFKGAQETGKTLAAEVPGLKLALVLCYIDLMRIVSKYIGETERSLDLR
jgi:SpoVK/Ycf46/Vps4 family AAA+-type ATPase